MSWRALYISGCGIVLDHFRSNFENRPRSFWQKSILNPFNLPSFSKPNLISLCDSQTNNEPIKFGVTDKECLEFQTNLMEIYNASQDDRKNKLGWFLEKSTGDTFLYARKCPAHVDYSTFKDNRCNFFKTTAINQEEYCVIGGYKDISCQDFIESYVDNEYRELWDVHTTVLKKLGTDPRNDSHILEWVISPPLPLFPYQKYVYARRVYKDKNNFMIINRSCDDITETNKLVGNSIKPDVRNTNIVNYRSTFLLIPHTNFDEPGFDYVMFYYEQVETKTSFIPTYIIYRIVFSTVDKLHDAAIKYKQKKLDSV